jgi:uncharacterized protein DUF5655
MKKPLWICPQCGAPLVTPNLWHSCVKVTSEELFARSEPHVIEVFNRFVEVVRSIGEVTVVLQKTRVVLVARVRFCGGEPRKDCFYANFALHRRLESPRIHKIIEYTPRWITHHLKLRSKDEIDEELHGWLAESFALGRQDDLFQES